MAGAEFEPTSGCVEFVMDKVVLGQVFSEYFGFPCQFLFRRLLHTHHLSGAGTVGQLVADVPSGLSLTHPKKLKKILNTDRRIPAVKNPFNIVCTSLENSVFTNTIKQTRSILF
jgi:hypothetical protein